MLGVRQNGGTHTKSAHPTGTTRTRLNRLLRLRSKLLFTIVLGWKVALMAPHANRCLKRFGSYGARPSRAGAPSINHATRTFFLNSRTSHRNRNR